MLDSEDGGRPWLFDPETLSRGDLIEVEVALEADPIFHIVEVFGTVMALFRDNEDIFGYDVAAQLSQVASLVRVLEGLLAGLVPVRGRLVAYRSATIGDKNVLIHHRLSDQFDTDDSPKLRSAYVVGVADRDLFWKDIRRVLFSKAEYTAFCRVATEAWHHMAPGKGRKCIGWISSELRRTNGRPERNGSCRYSRYGCFGSKQPPWRSTSRQEHTNSVCEATGRPPR